MGRYGDYGRPVLAFEAWQEWSEGLALQEADSKADFPAWLWGPVRRAVWAGYEAVASEWQRYVRIEDMPDFRPRLMHGLNRLRGFGYVGDDGEYPGMKRSERGGPALVIDTYGAVYAITRQAIINDDTGELLNRNPREMGEEAARFVTEAVIALLEANPTAYDGDTMFSNTRGNQTTADLSEDSLADAITFLENLLDDDGYHIVIRPRWLIVKSARQEMVARRILNSTITGTTINYTGGTAGVGTALMDKGNLNPLAGILPGDAVIREPWLTDPNNWYLLADADRTPLLSVGFLNGNREPFVGLKDPMVRNAMGPGMDPYSFEFDSIDFKVRQDFGVAAVDFRAGYRGVVA